MLQGNVVCDRALRVFGGRRERVFDEMSRSVREMVGWRKEMMGCGTVNHDAFWTGSIHDYYRGLVFLHFAHDAGIGGPIEIAAKALDSAQEYFFGAWRDAYSFFPGEPWNRQQCHENLCWYFPFRESVCVSLLLDDWESTRKFSEYPVAPHADDPEATFDEQEFYVLLAGQLRGEPPEALTARRRTIEASRRRAPKFWLETLDAINAHDRAAITTGLRKSCALFRKQQDVTIFHLAVSVDASILWNLARLNGCVIEDLSVDEWDVILTPKSCGISRPSTNSSGTDVATTS
jgi:hypothetical protein